MKKNNSSDENKIDLKQDNIGEQNTNISIDENDIAVIIKTGTNNKTPVLITVLPVLAMLIALPAGILSKDINLEAARFGIIALLLTGIVVFYIRFNLAGSYNRGLFKTIVILSYLAALALLLYIPQPDLFSFWMLGGLCIGIMIDQKLGLLVNFLLSVFMGACLIQSPEAIIRVMLMGFLMVLLSGALKHKATAGYAAVIILSTDITVAFALNNFIFQSENSFNYIYSLFCVLIILIIAFILNSIYKLKYNELKVSSTDNIQSLQLQEGQAAVDDQLIKSSDNDSSYELLCDRNNTLLVELKQYSEELYMHAERIADISHRAAVEVGADERLALAGGLYHEIGKIRSGTNYIEDGLLIAEEYKFPSELKAIIREHNIKYGKPASIEAAIVMLSDNVEASISYIARNEGNKYTPEKIIDNIFKLRMDKGTFDDCPLIIHDYKKLREFFINEYINAQT